MTQVVRKWWLHLALVIATLEANLSANDQVSLFSELPKGDEIRLIYKTQGCFGGGTCELLFENRTNVSATFWYFQGPSEATKVLGGSISLSEADLRGLDKLLWFYRSNPGGDCTTVDEIKVTHLRKKEILATEQFTDRSCSHLFSRPEVEGVLTIGTLISKMDRPPTHWTNSDSPYVPLATIGVTILAVSAFWWAIFPHQQ